MEIHLPWNGTLIKGKTIRAKTIKDDAKLALELASKLVSKAVQPKQMQQNGISR